MGILPILRPKGETGSKRRTDPDKLGFRSIPGPGMLLMAQQINPVGRSEKELEANALEARAGV